MARRFVRLSIWTGVMTLILATSAGAWMPTDLRPQAETCLADVTPACLADLASALMGAAPEGSVDEEALVEMIAEMYFNVGDVADAARYAASVEPYTLMYLLERHAAAVRDVDPALLAPIHRTAESHLATASTEPDLADALAVQAEAVRILAASEATGRASEVLTEAIATFRAGLAAGDAKASEACGDLAEAAIALRDPAVADALVIALTGPDRKEDQASLQRVPANCLVTVVRLLAGFGDPDGAIAAWRALGGPESRYSGLSADILVSLLEAGRLQAAFAIVAEIAPEGQDGPFGGTLGPRDMTLTRAIDELVSEGRLGEAEALLGAMQDPWSRQNQFTSIALAHLDAGDVDEVRRVLARMSDPGGQAAIQLQLAKRFARAGESETARRLVAEAERALEGETDPDRLVYVGLDRAFILLELGDVSAARRAAKEALRPASESRDPFMDQPDPMVLVDMAALGAAFEYLRGDPLAAYAMFESLAADFLRRPPDMLFAELMAARHLAYRGHADLAGDIVARVLGAVYDDAQFDPDDAVYFTSFAAEALARR